MSTPSSDLQQLARGRIVIENVKPLIDGGRHALKREVGDVLTVEATIFRDGHDVIAAALRYRPQGSETWIEAPMECSNPGKDLWVGSFKLEQVATYTYTIEAWTDTFESWRRDLKKRVEAGQDVTSELLEGRKLLREAVYAAEEPADKQALTVSERVIGEQQNQAEAVRLALDDALARIMSRYPSGPASSSPSWQIVVDRERARFAAWYEMFPRSQLSPPPPPSTGGEETNGSPPYEGGVGRVRSATFRDCIARLPDIQRMGFDVVYLPPIHPIGKTHRKGKNNTLVAGPDDPGSPWGIGSEAGGHKAIEPSLGTLADFTAFVHTARDHGIEIALDFAIQCSPDHPYVREHPEWFYHRPDGSIKYAENPPKKYQDIYPLNFDCEAWPALWEEMKSIILFWIEHGVKIFRVDNPHTKPIPFWEWLIREIKRRHPDVIFLAEAFTRPAMMKHLAKIGFTQSYTYFTWRNGRDELVEYFTELTHSEMAEYFRGNLFANTPDILHAYLQHGGRPAFKIRYLLAATLSSLCGIYSGYELCENTPLHEGSEEYLHSEKYEIKPRDWDAPGNIKEVITRVNRARRENPALQLYENLRFHPCNNPNLLCYSKATPDRSNVVIVAVNVDPHNGHDCVVSLNLDSLGLGPDQYYRVYDVISGSEWTWHGAHNYVRLWPHQEPAHLFVVRR
jgi:starch synthase (maltosyl-transferring)